MYIPWQYHAAPPPYVFYVSNGKLRFLGGVADQVLRPCIPIKIEATFAKHKATILHLFLF